MDGKEFAEALLGALERQKKRRLQRAWSEESLKELIQDALDPKPLEENFIFSPTPAVDPNRFDPDAFPKLKVKYGADLNTKGLSGEKLVAALKAPRNLSATSWIVVNNGNEEEPYHGSGWLTRPMKELEQLKAENVVQFQPPKKKGNSNGNPAYSSSYSTATRSNKADRASYRH